MCKFVPGWSVGVRNQTGVGVPQIRTFCCIELQACDRDQQCGGGMCCAVSLWIRSLRMCTPMGNLGEECHPLSHRVPFSGRRMHHTCPCLPSLACIRTSPSKFKCLPDFRKEDVFF
ncbi:prokineticin-2 [Egretta garzetta]|nr:prokineticin-2 [Egretta garzetta]